MTQTLLEALASLERQLGGTLGVAASPLPAREPSISFHEHEAFPSASTIKVFVLQTLLEQVGTGVLALDLERRLMASDKVTGTGVLKALSVGSSHTLLDLATLMIVVSDNSATNMLIDVLGVDRINGVIQAHGWADTWLAGPLQKPAASGGEMSSLSRTSPADLADYFQRLWAGELLPDSLAQIATNIYRRQQRTDQLGRYLPFDAYATETDGSDVVIASKSGSLRGVRNDAGVISKGDAGFVLAIMTKDCPDRRFHLDNLGSVVVSEVSKLLYEHFLAAA